MTSRVGWLGAQKPEVGVLRPTREKLVVVYRTPGYIRVGQLVEAVVGLKSPQWWGSGRGGAKGNKRETRQL